MGQAAPVEISIHGRSRRVLRWKHPKMCLPHSKKTTQNLKQLSPQAWAIFKYGTFSVDNE